MKKGEDTEFNLVEEEDYPNQNPGYYEEVVSELLEKQVKYPPVHRKFGGKWSQCKDCPFKTNQKLKAHERKCPNADETNGHSGWIMLKNKTGEPETDQN
jgi:hypothetical protein